MIAESQDVCKMLLKALLGSTLSYIMT